MEKIKLSNDQLFEIIPMGISSSDKKRVLIISSDLQYANIETAFLNVDRIEYLSESGEVLAVYTDGVSVKTISKDIENGTYTIEIGTDAVERHLRIINTQIDDLTNTVVMISMF